MLHGVQLSAAVSGGAGWQKVLSLFKYSEKRCQYLTQQL
jgi:hypothetical protein